MSASRTTTYDGVERRAAPRARVPCRVVASGAGADGAEFDVEGLLLDVSTTGLLARLQRPVEPGALMIFLIHAAADGVVGPYSPARGVVLRVEARPDGTCDVAARFTQMLSGRPGEGGSPIRCPGCGRLLGMTDGREARFADVIFDEAVEVPCPDCHQTVEWRPAGGGENDNGED